MDDEMHCVFCHRENPFVDGLDLSLHTLRSLFCRRRKLLGRLGYNKQSPGRKAVSHPVRTVCQLLVWHLPQPAAVVTFATLGQKLEESIGASSCQSLWSWFCQCSDNSLSYKRAMQWCDAQNLNAWMSLFGLRFCRAWEKWLQRNSYNLVVHILRISRHSTVLRLIILSVFGSMVVCILTGLATLIQEWERGHHWCVDRFCFAQVNSMVVFCSFVVTVLFTSWRNLNSTLFFFWNCVNFSDQGCAQKSADSSFFLHVAKLRSGCVCVEITIYSHPYVILIPLLVCFCLYILHFSSISTNKCSLPENTSDLVCPKTVIRHTQLANENLFFFFVCLFFWVFFLNRISSVWPMGYPPWVQNLKFSWLGKAELWLYI